MRLIWRVSAIVLVLGLPASADAEPGYSGLFTIDNTNPIGDSATGYSALFTIDNKQSASGESGTGYSGPFKIDNVSGETRARPPAARAVSPYTENAHQLRGQLHAHSRPDKGWAGRTMSDNELAELYRGQGYDFLAVTNHHNPFDESSISCDSLNPFWSGWAPRSVELTYGLEGARDGHVLAIGNSPGTWVADLTYDARGGTSEPRDVVDNMTHRIRNVWNRFGLALIAHPDAPGYEVTSDELLQICRQSRPDAVSIYHILSRSESKWDQLLASYRAPVWGYAEDDFHPDAWSRPLLASAWISVPGPLGLEWNGSGGIEEQLRNGNYYIGWAPGWRWIGDPPTMHVTVDNSAPYPVIRAELQGLGGKPATLAFRTPEGYFPGTEYNCSGNEVYVRVQADVDIGWGRTMYIRSQPILIEPLDTTGFALRTSGKLGMLSTSPELRLRYLGGGEKPSAPLHGYVGHAFDVTTDNGQVPPDATLELSYDGEDTSAIGGTQYLAIYHYDTGTSAWAKVGGTVNPGAATIEAPIAQLGYYTISADLPADTTAPEVFIDNPPSGGIVNTDTTVKATVNDDLGAWRVQFYMNDHILKEDADALDFWTADIPIANYCEGDYTLKAVAEDLAGNTGTTEIPIHIHSSTPPPTVAITSPTAGANLSGAITATGTCGDDVAVAMVTLQMGDTLVGFGEVNGSDWTCDVDTTYLVDGARTLSATVEDYPGNEATASVGVSIANGGAAPIGGLKSLAPGASAKFAGAIVVAGTDLVGGAFYAEDAGRISGVRVLTGQTVSEKDMVSVSGVMTTVGTEKAVQAYDVYILSHNNTLPDPLGASGMALLGRTPDSIGKIVRVWGRVTSTDPSSPARWFTIDDGSLINVKCSTPVGVTPPSAGYAVVTGVCSVDAVTGGPMILLRGPDDLALLQ